MPTSSAALAAHRSRKKVPKSKRAAISKKISHLVKSEGKPQKQAVAIAYNMARSGRLTKGGGYRRAKKK